MEEVVIRFADLTELAILKCDCGNDFAVSRLNADPVKSLSSNEYPNQPGSEWFEVQCYHCGKTNRVNGTLVERLF